MKLPIEFGVEFDKDHVIPIHLGRLQLGGHIGRLYFAPDGKMHMVIDKRAVEDGSIKLYEWAPAEADLFGLAAKEEAGISGHPDQTKGA